MTEPTPKRWKADGLAIRDGDGHEIGFLHDGANDFYREEQLANTRLIVTAVNCHDELSNFADDFKTWWEQAGQHFYSDDDGLISLAEDANAILTKVRAQSEPGE